MAEKEYISRDVAIFSVKAHYPKEADIIASLVCIPAADARPVVLCRDCKNRFNYSICAQRGDDWFCGYGEKREES